MPFAFVLSRFALILIALVMSMLTSAAAEGRSSKMNFVFVLIDDLGWADLSCYGSTFHETPHLDALAGSGYRFEQAYAACPVCSPTRASILTGRHPVRVDITDWIPGQTGKGSGKHRFLPIEDRNELALEEVTIAEVLQAAGYQTFFAGKWHLGGEGYLPTDQGFDTNLGGAHYGQPPAGYFAPWKNPYLQERFDGEFLTERLTDESISFLKQRDPSRPFLLYLSHYDVHTPIHSDKKHVAHFQAKRDSLGVTPSAIPERRGISNARQENAQYASMVSAIDDSVGRLMTELRNQNLLDSTTIIFTSDNGGLCTLRKPGPTCNLPLRSGKGWLYEGGIRVPLIVKSPAATQSGEVIDWPVLSTEFFPTILELAGLDAQPNLAADGVSFAPSLRGEQQTTTRPLVWHYPHYHGSEWTPGAAIRDGDWKLIEFYEFGDAELYNLRLDPGEHRDLWATEPDRALRLRRLLREWQQSMNAQMPIPDPDYQQ